MSVLSYPHRVAELRARRKESSTRPFLARGHQVVRCDRCRLSMSYCICIWQPKVVSDVGVCLLMYDTEPLKPSNTGWLIADIVQETYAFSWSRVGDTTEIEALLNDEHWQPYVVFPGEYAEPERVHQTLVISDKKPLFILLDGTWSEARKIFRKSPYLDQFPVLSISPEQVSRYRLRRSNNEAHLCTAEVAALCIEQAGEEHVAQALNSWLDIFTQHYLASRESRKINTADVLHQQIMAFK